MNTTHTDLFAALDNIAELPRRRRNNALMAVDARILALPASTIKASLMATSQRVYDRYVDQL